MVFSLEGAAIAAFVVLLIVGGLAWLERHDAPLWQLWLLCWFAGALLIGLFGVVIPPFSVQRVLVFTIVGFLSGVIITPFLRLPYTRRNVSRGGRHDNE